MPNFTLPDQIKTPPALRGTEIKPDTLLERITFNPTVCSGRPTIRNMRFTVAQMLELLASGMSADDILSDYPFVEIADIQACLLYAAQIANAKTLLPLAA